MFRNCMPAGILVPGLSLTFRHGRLRREKWRRRECVLASSKAIDM